MVRQAHQPEIRERTLEYIKEGGKIKEACRIFKVSRMSLYRWRKKQEEQGTVKDKKRCIWSRKVDRAELEKYVSANPDKYLHEMATHFGVAISTIWNNLRSIGVVYKNETIFRTR